MYNARRTGKIIYPPLSSISDEKPKRSVMPDGRLLYESPHMNWGPDQNKSIYENTQHQSSSNSSHYYNQYDNGTFSVLSREPMKDCNIYRV